MNSRSASTARSSACSASLPGRDVLNALKLASMDSQKRVAPASPTMRNAPDTWCRCPGHGASSARLSGSTENLAICSRTTARAWLTSAVIQERRVESGLAIPAIRRA